MLVEENTLFVYKKIVAEYVIAETGALGSWVFRMKIWILSLYFGGGKVLSLGLLRCGQGFTLPVVRESSETLAF